MPRRVGPLFRWVSVFSLFSLALAKPKITVLDFSGSGIGDIIVSNYELTRLLFKTVDTTKYALSFNKEDTAQTNFLIFGTCKSPENGRFNLEVTAQDWRDGTLYEHKLAGNLPKIREGLTHFLQSLFITVAVSSRPEAALVRLDDSLIGKTPLLLHDIPIGKHTLEVTKPGYLVYSCTLNLEESKALAIELKEEPSSKVAELIGAEGRVEGNKGFERAQQSGRQQEDRLVSGQGVFPEEAEGDSLGYIHALGPPWYEVHINGRLIGQSGGIFRLAKGEYELRLLSPQFGVRAKRIRVVPNDVKKISLFD